MNIVSGHSISQGVWNDTIPYRFHTEFGVILKHERFSHLSSLSFGLGSPIELIVLSLVLLLRVDM